MYTQPPSAGILTAERSFLRFAGANYTDPRYSDVLYGYDAWGNRTSVTTYTAEGTYASLASTGGATSHVAYDSLYYTYPLLSLDAGGNASLTSYDYALGVPTQETAPNGAVTKGYYDAFGRLTSGPAVRQRHDYATTTFSYHIPDQPSLNNPFWTEANQTGEGGLNVKVRKFYSGLGQLIQTQQVGLTLDVGTNKSRWWIRI